MTLQQLGKALSLVGVPCRHYFAIMKDPEYIIWAEDDGGGTYADNHRLNELVSGTIDLFTKAEFSPTKVKIEKTLNSLDLAWGYNATQVEEDSQYIHHEWVWEMVMDG